MAKEKKLAEKPPKIKIISAEEGKKLRGGLEVRLNNNWNLKIKKEKGGAFVGFVVRW